MGKAMLLVLSLIGLLFSGVGLTEFSGNLYGIFRESVQNDADLKSSSDKEVSDLRKTHRFIDDIQESMTGQFGYDLAVNHANVLRQYFEQNCELFYEIPVGGSYTPDDSFSTVESAVNWAMQQEPLPATVLDSALRVVNYVFTHHPFGDSSPVMLNSIYDKSMEGIGKHVNDLSLAGLCGELAYFTEAIINTLFPHWGTAVSLSSCLKVGFTTGHILVGIADREGKISMLIDPSVNGIWINRETGLPLSLEQARGFLKNKERANKVIKSSSTIFGECQKTYLQGNRIIRLEAPDLSVLKAYQVPGNSEFFLIPCGLYPIDDPESLGFKNLYAPIWAQAGYPSVTWANNLLDINAVTCENAELGRVISERYEINQHF